MTRLAFALLFAAFTPEISSAWTVQESAERNSIMPVPRYVQSCVARATDPYDRGVQVRDVDERLACVDNQNVRPPEIIRDDGRTVTIANFRHARRWWTAKIPLDAITKVQMITGVFGGWSNLFGAAHAMYRVATSRAVVLTSQDRAFAIERMSLDGFIISGDPYSAIGFEGGFLVNSPLVRITMRFSSVSERILEMLAEGSYSRLIVSELPLDSAHQTSFVETAIRRSARIGYRDHYNFLHHNCVQVAFETLDEAFPPTRPVNALAVAATNVLSFNTVIAPIRQGLEDRGFAPLNGTSLLFNEASGTADSVVQAITLESDPARRESILAMYRAATEARAAPPIYGPAATKR